MPQGSKKQTINPQAYNALADALTAVYWNKPPFERYVRGMLASCPEILAALISNRPNGRPRVSWSISFAPTKPGT